MNSIVPIYHAITGRLMYRAEPCHLRSQVQRSTIVVFLLRNSRPPYAQARRMIRFALIGIVSLITVAGPALAQQSPGSERPASTMPANVP